MRKRVLLFIFLLISVFSNVIGQNVNGDRLLGIYLTEGGKAEIQIQKSGTYYTGKLIWTITKGAVDKNNPIKSERAKKLVGKTILTGFKYAGKDVWENGKIYDPENGKTYKCKMTLKKGGNLIVRGFIGISLLGRNSHWKRIK